MRYRAQVPLRVDFAGGWTDVPAFSDAEGGAVLNAAIDIYAKGYIIRPGTLPAPNDFGRSAVGDRGRDPGARWLLKRTVARGEENVVRYELKAPAGAGLGASAAQTLLWLTLVKTMIANVSERRDLAERAWRIENELGILGGKQDQYCCALGGVNFMSFGPETVVEPVKPGLRCVEELEGRLSLFYTGVSRHSGAVHRQIWERYGSGDREVIDSLREMRALAAEGRVALEAENLERLGDVMNRNWACQKRLHPAVSNPQLDQMAERALNSGAIGAKATGAGGGGCLLCLAEPGAAHGLSESMRELGAKLLPFHFDWYGVHLTKG